MISTLGIVQARTSSTRFPGKVLQPLFGLPMVLFMLERCRRARRIDELIVATSVDRWDDRLASIVEQHGFRCFRGSLGDVLDRFCKAALPCTPERIVRLTGDCPLVDADVIDSVIEAQQSSGAAYASNIHQRTFPRGLDVECFSFSALERAWREAHGAAYREHVTPYLSERADLFSFASVRGVADFSRLRWAVDYPVDLDLIRELLRRAGASNPAGCDRFDLYRLIEADPALASWNKLVDTEGFVQSPAEAVPSP